MRGSGAIEENGGARKIPLRHHVRPSSQGTRENALKYLRSKKIYLTKVPIGISIEKSMAFRLGNINTLNQYISGQLNSVDGNEKKKCIAFLSILKKSFSTSIKQALASGSGKPIELNLEVDVGEGEMKNISVEIKGAAIDFNFSDLGEHCNDSHIDLIHSVFFEGDTPLIAGGTTFLLVNLVNCSSVGTDKVEQMIDMVTAKNEGLEVEVLGVSKLEGLEDKFDVEETGELEDDVEKTGELEGDVEDFWVGWEYKRKQRPIIAQVEAYAEKLNGEEHNE